jgi:hypothetical protein
VALPDIETYLGHKVPFSPIAPELLATGVVTGAPVHRSRPHGGGRSGGGGRPGGGRHGGGGRDRKGSPAGRSHHRGRGR